MNRERRERQQLPDEVAAYVRELIFSGEARPGEYLRMEPIADAVGVSNTPVREGLLTLRSEGLVRLVPRHGFAVEEFSPEDVHDQFWVQAQLAGELSARAAKRIDADGLAALAANLEQYDAAVAADDEARIVQYGVGFHRQINLAAASPRLGLILRSVAQQLPNRFYAELERTSVDTHHDHANLLEAVRSGDARLSRKLMEEHMLERSAHLVELLRMRGIWDEGRPA